MRPTLIPISPFSVKPGSDIVSPPKEETQHRKLSIDDVLNFGNLDASEDFELQVSDRNHGLGKQKHRLLAAYNIGGMGRGMEGMG